MYDVHFDAGHRLWRGKVFEVGEWPEREFSLSEEEADEAIAAFTPVDADLEHQRSVFEGKLGKLVRLFRRGADILGDYEAPEWLSNVLHGEPVKVSLQWASEPKRVSGMALTWNPGIDDAALVAAFTASLSTTPRIGKTMNAFKRLQALFSKVEVSETELSEIEAAVEAEAKAAAGKDTLARLVAENESLVAKLAEAAARNEVKDAQRVGDLANAFADDAIKAGKAVPAERELLAAQFVLGARDDSGVAFTADGALVEGERVKLLRRVVEARPTMNWTKEQIEAHVKGEADFAKDQAETDRLLAMTPAGRERLKARVAGK